MQSFYKGINPTVKHNINSLYEGSIWNKTPKELLDLIKEIATAKQILINKRALAMMKSGIMDMDEMTILKAKLDALIREMKNMKVNAISPIEL